MKNIGCAQFTVCVSSIYLDLLHQMVGFRPEKHIRFSKLIFMSKRNPLALKHWIPLCRQRHSHNGKQCSKEIRMPNCLIVKSSIRICLVCFPFEGLSQIVGLPKQGPLADKHNFPNRTSVQVHGLHGYCGKA